MIQSFILFVTGLINVVFGVAVYRRATSKSANRLFLVLTIATAVWAWGVALFMMISDIELAQLFVDVYYIAALVIASTLLVFGWNTFMGAKVGLMAYIAYLPPVLLALASLYQSGVVVRVVSEQPILNSRVEINYDIYGAYSIVFLVLSIVAMYLYALNTLTHTGRVKRRQLMLLYGMIGAYALGILFNLLLPALGTYQYVGLGPLFSLVFIISAGLAVLRYSMFDLRYTLARSVAYIAALTIAWVAYAMAAWVVTKTLVDNSYWDRYQSVIYGVLAVGLAMTLSPLRRGFDRLTSKLFLKQGYDPDIAIDEFGDRIADAVSVKHTLDEGVRVLSQALQPDYVVVMLVGEHRKHTNHWFAASPQQPREIFVELEPIIEDEIADRQLVAIDALHDTSQLREQAIQMDTGVISRLINHGNTVGYVIIGQRGSGESYMTTDLRFIATVTDELSLAVQNALRFDEIQKFNTRLKSEINHATAELRESNDQLKKLDAAKDEFISMASHQLRTPLTSAKGYISMVLDGDVGKISADQRRLLGEAFQSSERMVHLIEDFLNVSRIQTGKFTIEPVEANLETIITEEVAELQALAAAHDIEQVYKKTPVIPTMMIDEGKIRQVVMNFIDNAIYYSHDGSRIVINLRLEAHEVVFAVTDHGIGVPKGQQRQLFKRFFRADNARVHRPDGTGIGLFLAKMVIDAHGGKVLFESTEGKGSTFGFRLPIRTHAAQPKHPRK